MNLFPWRKLSPKQAASEQVATGKTDWAKVDAKRGKNRFPAWITDAASARHAEKFNQEKKIINFPIEAEKTLIPDYAQDKTSRAK